MLDAVATLFPRFARLAAKRDLEHVLPAATPAEVTKLEEDLGLALPDSYKALAKSKGTGTFVVHLGRNNKRARPLFCTETSRSLQPARQVNEYVRLPGCAMRRVQMGQRLTALGLTFCLVGAGFWAPGAMPTALRGHVIGDTVE